MSNVLTDKQKRFCREYVIDSNGTQAAIRAGYSKKTADVQAVRLLGKVKVKNLVKELQQKVAGKLEITAERTIAEIARIAFGNVPSLFNQDGTLKKFSELTSDQIALFSSIESDEKNIGSKRTGITKKIKVWDKTKALEMLAKHFGLFEKDNAQQNIVLIPKKITHR